MNPERLLEHFDRLSEAPDAIPRLRRFILDLAVRGKLVKQDLNDEPASELLKRIHGEKSRLIKKQKEAAEMDGTGVSLEVPPNWKLIPLITLGTWAIGAGFPKNEQGIQDGPYFFLKVSDMNLPGNEKYIVSSQNFIDEAAAARMRAKIHPSGTIIFPKIGGAIATNKRRILTRGSAIDNNCLGITFWSNLSVDWCYLLLTTLDFTQYQAGTAVPALQQSILEQIPVSLPPLAEQHRIVAKVDELMSLYNQLEATKTEREQSRDRLVAASLHHLNPPANAEEANTLEALRDHARFLINHLPHLITRPVHLKQLRQTILNLAVRGKLVPQDTNDEPAAELLKRIHAEKERLIAAGKIRIQPPHAKNQHGDGYMEIPPSWIAVKLIDIVYLRSGSAVEHGDEMTDGPIPYVKVADLSLDANSNGIVTSSRFIAQKYSGSIIESGSVVFPKRGGAIATNRKRISRVEIVCDSNLMAMKPFLNETTDYLQLWFSGFDLWKLNSGTTVPQINNKDIYPLCMPLPPLAEQHRIVAKVDELMALCDQLEAQLTTTEADRRRLLEAVLHEALNPPLEATE